VHSRCRHVHFRPLDDTAMAQWFDRSGVDVTGAERQWINEFCDGSPGVATLAAEYGFHRWHTTLTPMLDDLADGRFPAEMGATLAALVEGFAVEWVKRHENASKDAANKDGIRFVLSILAAHANRQLTESVQRGAPDDTALKAIDLIAEAEEQAWANINVKLLLENLVVQWARVGALIPTG